MKKFLAGAALCLAAFVALSIWNPAGKVRVFWTALQGQELPANPIARATIAPIEPSAREDQTDPVRVTLYFRYGNTAYLGQEAYDIRVPRTSTLENAIVSALLDGPDGRHNALSGVFPEGTRVLDTVRDGDRVIVTLNAAFLALPSGAPEEWMEHDYWSQEVPRRRRLALESIVLSLTEDARCRSVQLLVSGQDGLADGQRVARSLFFPEEYDASITLEPMTRPEASILTPHNAAHAALAWWQAKDYQSLYGILTVGGRDSGAMHLPALGEFVQAAADAPCSLLAFEVSDGSVSPEGTRATVIADMQLADAEGLRVHRAGVPISLVRVDENWMVAYGDIMALMQAQ